MKPRHSGQAVAACLAALTLILTVSACTSTSGGHGSGATSTGSSITASSSSPAASGAASTTATGPTTTVKVSSDLNDGVVVGVGEPIVLNFSPTPKDSTEFTKAVTVTVNGQPADGAWYWEKPYADQPVQAHYREKNFWPANATIQVKLPIGGLSAGPGLSYSGALSSITFQTGDAHISTVDATDLTMTVTSNGKQVNKIPVSLGAAETPTFNGIKVVMQKGEAAPGSSALRPNGEVSMSGPGYTGDIVPWSVRVTASGEYVHAAGWNTHIGVRSTSNGCTNLKPADGEWFYKFSQLGDVVEYHNTDGAKMPSWDGLGDWNVNWALWQQGGLLVNH